MNKQNNIFHQAAPRKFTKVQIADYRVYMGLFKDAEQFVVERDADGVLRVKKERVKYVCNRE